MLLRISGRILIPLFEPPNGLIIRYLLFLIRVFMQTDRLGGLILVFNLRRSLPNFLLPQLVFLYFFNSFPLFLAELEDLAYGGHEE